MRSFTYKGKEYSCNDGVCRCDGEIIDHSDYAYAKNLYEDSIYESLKASQKKFEEYAENYLVPYCIWYVNDYGIRLYEHKGKKWRRDKDPETIRRYNGKIGAYDSIHARHKYNDVIYHIERIS